MSAMPLALLLATAAATAVGAAALHTLRGLRRQVAALRAELRRRAAPAARRGLVPAAAPRRATPPTRYAPPWPRRSPRSGSGSWPRPGPSGPRRRRVTPSGRALRCSAASGPDERRPCCPARARPDFAGLRGLDLPSRSLERAGAVEREPSARAGGVPPRDVARAGRGPPPPPLAPGLRTGRSRRRRRPTTSARWPAWRSSPSPAPRSPTSAPARWAPWTSTSSPTARRSA